jgi:glycosyltransferase involved in cell wall biosynthesis
MTLHLIALPHTRVSEEFVGCAYTSKALKFCHMFFSHEDVILYAPEGSTRATRETVPVITEDERTETFGEDDPNRLPSWPTDAQARDFNDLAAVHLSQRWEPGDLILLTGGMTHAPIMEFGPKEAIYCEPGVGYEGIATGFCAFESHAWRHYVYGKRGIENGRWFDAVIPNYFSLFDFEPLVEEPTRDYLAFLGRIVPRKGPTVALEIAKEAGLPLWVAGAGATFVSEGRIEAGMGTPEEVVLEGDVQYVGPVNAEERRIFLGNAKALLVPTSYIEPFGGVAVEAMLMGTPVITSPWGAFSETVWQGLTGFRINTLREGVEAVGNVDGLRPEMIRSMAQNRYSLDAVRPRFSAWFDQLRSLHGKGWYEMSSSSAKISG